ncbi:MAG: hypothetical protein ACK41C_12195 [Phenylobacterium sp.]|uniref:hypothetical protein n=1 Tax=Phenylobacterium sp. TaxID=1871053 RepID=UPI003919625D
MKELSWWLSLGQVLRISEAARRKLLPVGPAAASRDVLLGTTPGGPVVRIGLDRLQLLSPGDAWLTERPHILHRGVLRDPHLVAEVDAETSATDALLRSIFAIAPGRSQFAALAELMPLAAPWALKASARAAALVEQLRPSLLGAFASSGQASSTRLLDYWLLIHVSAHLALLAISCGPHDWLKPLLASVQPKAWTPSLAFTRERTLWLAAAGARVAAGFGSAAADVYFSVLDGTPPLGRVFDAVVGLLAIAKAHPKETDWILNALEERLRERRRGSEEFTEVWTAIARAIAEARAPTKAGKPPDPLSLIDPAAVDSGGALPALRCGQSFAARPCRDLYPKSNPTRPHAGVLAAMLLRSWRLNPEGAMH